MHPRRVLLLLLLCCALGSCDSRNTPKTVTVKFVPWLNTTAVSGDALKSIVSAEAGAKDLNGKPAITTTVDRPLTFYCIVDVVNNDDRSFGFDVAQLFVARAGNPSAPAPGQQFVGYFGPAKITTVPEGKSVQKPVVVVLQRTTEAQIAPSQILNGSADSWGLLYKPDGMFDVKMIPPSTPAEPVKYFKQITNTVVPSDCPEWK